MLSGRTVPANPALCLGNSPPIIRHAAPKMTRLLIPALFAMSQPEAPTFLSKTQPYVTRGNKQDVSVVMALRY